MKERKRRTESWLKNKRNPFPSPVTVQSQPSINHRRLLRTFLLEYAFAFPRVARLTRRLEIDTCTLPTHTQTHTHTHTHTHMPIRESNAWRATQKLWRSVTRVCAGARIKTCQRVSSLLPRFLNAGTQTRVCDARETQSICLHVAPLSLLTLIRVALICSPVLESCRLRGFRQWI